MMPTAAGMSHLIPTHVLRVGQTVQLHSTTKDTRANHLPSLADSSVEQCDNELDISMENLNQLILELDPTFEPLQVLKSPSSDKVSSPVLIPRGCPSHGSPTVMSVSPSIPIPTQSGLTCSPHGALACTGSPSSALPPLPCGSVVRRSPSMRSDSGFCQGSLRLCHSNRNSAVSLLSTSSCSDTSYMLGSTLSLTSEDVDSAEFNVARTFGSFSDVSRGKLCDNGHSSDKPLSPKQKHLQRLHNTGVHSSPASLAGSLTDIPVLLVNGAPQPDSQICPQSPGLQTEISVTEPFSPQSPRCYGSQPSMKFVMDTSKFWFRPHISRADADAMVKDKESGTFVIRDSTSYKGSFGLAMKVDQSPTGFSPTAYAGENSSDRVRHFLIESSAKGVRIKGSSQEPYFGSLSALVYQHSICAYALPCKLLLFSQELGTTEENEQRSAAREDKSKTASNFVYLNAVPTEMLTGPCAVQKAVSLTFDKAPGSFTPTVVNMKVSQKGVTLTDINRKLFFRRHYPAHLISYSGEDPDSRRWVRGSSFGARMFGFVAKGVEAGIENVCHVFAEYDPLQPCNKIVEFVQAAITKP